MSDAVCWQIMNDVVDGLRTIAFEPVGGDRVQRIRPDNIQLRKYRYPRNRNENRGNQATPRIDVSFVKAKRDPRAGTNVRDDVLYVIAIEVIDRDDHERISGERTYLKWMEMIARYVHNSITQNVQTYEEGQVCIGTSPSSDTTTEGMWESDRLSQSTVFATFKVREPRGYDT